MNSLSVSEFKKVCDSLSAHKFIFASENQEWNGVESSMKAQLTFRNMIIALNPNAICFKNSDSFLRLERIKSIEMNEKKSLLGTVFNVVCGDFLGDSHDISYTIIAQ